MRIFKGKILLTGQEEASAQPVSQLLMVGIHNVEVKPMDLGSGSWTKMAES